MSGSTHLRGLVIAGVLAAVALALVFVTLGMNQSTSSAAPQPVLSLKARKHTAAVETPKKVVKHKRLDANFVAALKAGLPRSIAHALAANRVAVISLATINDPVAAMATHEAKAGAQLAGVAFAQVSVDRDGGDASRLTSLLGVLPVAPATLVYLRPSTLVTTLPGFNDRTTVQQAATNADPHPAGAGARGSGWASQADAVCATTYAGVSASGGAAKLTLAQGLSVYGAMYRQLVALVPPAASKPRVVRANAQLKGSLTLLRQGAAAKAQGKPAAGYNAQSVTAAARFAAAYKALGVPSCGDKTSS